MMFIKHSFSLLLLAAVANACQDHQTEAISVINGVSPDMAGLNQTFEAFRFLLGGVNNGNAIGPFAGGHRQVNWDAGAVPFEMPGDFFAARVTRGMTVESESNDFRVSNPPGGDDNLFDSINPGASEGFSTFSAARLFTSVQENVITVTFSVPGDVNAPATVNGFGAVFVDVEEAYSTAMIFYDQFGCIFATEYARPCDDGFSFIGGHFVNPIIGGVAIVLGTAPLDREEDNEGGGGKRGKGKGKSKSKEDVTDFVVLDDFIYSEPQAVG